MPLISALPPIPVWDMIEQELLLPLKMSREDLAQAMGVHISVVNGISNNTLVINSNLAVGLAKAFKMSPEFWINLQSYNSLWEVRNFLENA